MGAGCLTKQAGTTTYTPVDEDVDPYMPVREGLYDVSPSEFVCLLNLSARRILPLVPEAIHDEGAFLLVQKGGRSREVMQRKKCDDGDDHGGNPLTVVRINTPQKGSHWADKQDSPSRMKIHCQPCSPAMPLILPIANASSPLKAPATDAALKNRACRSCISSRLYQLVR